MYWFLWLSYDIFGMEQPASIMARYYDYYDSIIIKFFQMREILAECQNFSIQSIQALTLRSLGFVNNLDN